MEKGVKSRRRILEVAFKLFATYSYPEVSYSLLEEATGLSRGSMVYYFKNKEGIFRAVLDEFFYATSNVCHIPPQTRRSLKEMCEAYMEIIVRCVARMKPYHVDNLSEAYFNLRCNASRFVPEFKDRQAELQRSEIEIWIETVKNSVESGELPPTTDIENTAMMFHSVAMGYFYMRAQHAPLNGTKGLEEMFSALYGLVARRV